ncbi:MAG: hemolysin family protein [Pseudomonadota bacterium]
MGDRADGEAKPTDGLEDQDSQSGLGTWLGWIVNGGKPDEGADPTSDRPTTEDAHAMLRNVRNMAEVRVASISVPRADIASVPIDATLEDVVALFRASSYSRLPVFEETLDNPLGFVHLKDISLHYGFDCTEPAFDLRKLLRPLLYVPPSMQMGVLLQKMQSERTHMALVIDEYGGVDGLVTIEDLVEQIVGEIADEHDDDEDTLWIEEAPGIYLSSARLALSEFESVSGVALVADETEEDIDTLGGLVFMLAGRVPARGEIVCHPGGHEFEVVDADPRSLKRIRVRLRSAVTVDQAAE